MKETEQYHWDLTDIFPDNTAFEKELGEVKQLVSAGFSKYKGKLNTTETVFAYNKETEDISIRLNRLYVYGSFLLSHNQEDAIAVDYQQQVSKLADSFAVASTPCQLEIINGSDSFWEALLSAPEAMPYATSLKRLREIKEHTLSESEELLLIPLYKSVNGSGTLYEKLVYADMKYNTIKNDKGEEIVVDEAAYGNIISTNKDQAYRKEAGEAIFGSYGEYRNTFAQNMDNFVQAQVSLAHSCKYVSAKQSALAGSFVPTQVYDNLIVAVDNSLETYRRNIMLRKKLLGVDTIFTTDMNYPLVEDLESTITYEQGKELVLNALEPLGEEYQTNLKKAFDERWIDVYPSEGKTTGAYSSGLFTVHPFVLHNYTDDLSSVSTLAHELGHAMHQYESEQNQKSINAAEPTSFTSEIASTTNELLFYDYMIKNAKTDEEKRVYLFDQLGMLIGTFYTQAMFAEFEDGMYKIVEDGGSLNAEKLEELWISINKKYFGDDCTLLDNAKFGWSRIPHFYYNFYVYQYATSVAAACSIIDGVESGDALALERYQTFLKAGDTGDGAEIIKLTGVDITDPKFADALIARCNRIMDQIEELKVK